MIEMRIDEIKVFVRVLDTGSFAAAARQLEMPTATVSAKVAALEKRLGATLIQRTTRQLRATAAGQLYFDRCKAALQEIELAEAELAPDADAPSGILRLTAPVGIGRILPELIASFRRSYPAVKVDVVLTNKLSNLIEEGIDLAMRVGVGQLKDSGMIARLLMRDDGGFYASAGYLRNRKSPASLADLSKHQVIGFGRIGGQPLTMTFRGKEVEVELDPGVSCDDFNMTRMLIAMDLGIGYLPPAVAKSGPGEPALIRVLPDYARHGATYLVYPQQRYVPARVRSFMAFALEAFRDRR